MALNPKQRALRKGLPTMSGVPPQPPPAPPGMVRTSDARGLDRIPDEVPPDLVRAAKDWAEREGAGATSEQIWRAFEVAEKRVLTSELLRVAETVADGLHCVWLEFATVQAAALCAARLVLKARKGPLTAELLEGHLWSWDTRKRALVRERFGSGAVPLAGSKRLLFCVNANGQLVYANVSELADTTAQQRLQASEEVNLALARLRATCPAFKASTQQQQQHVSEPAAIVALVRNACCYGCGAAKAAEVKLQLCSSCRGALYCSRACQAGDWKRHKKSECSDLRLVVERLRVHSMLSS